MSAEHPIYELPKATMDLRDYFAAAALQGMTADVSCDYTWTDMALNAYRAADAMMSARSVVDPSPMVVVR